MLDAATAPRPLADAAPEQMRARYPDQEGFAERDGVRLFYEVYGRGAPTIMLVPTWQIVHSRLWKPQIPYLARHGRVVTFDARGNGRSDRPTTSEAYAGHEMAADILSVLDATDTERAVLVALSAGVGRSLRVIAEQPHRVEGFVAIGPSLAIGERLPDRGYPFDEVLDTDEGWAKDNAHYWRRDFHGYLQFFFSRCFTEPHSTKQIEDCVGWGHEIGAETLMLGEYTAGLTEDETLDLCDKVRCPVLVVAGDQDAITGDGPARALAATVRGARLVTLAGGGHIPDARDPVLINLLIRDFVADIHPGFGRAKP